MSNQEINFIDIPVSFALRLKTKITGFGFLADIDCKNQDEVMEVRRKLLTKPNKVEIVAACFCFDAFRPDRKSYYLFDDVNKEILGNVLNSLHIGIKNPSKSYTTSFDIDLDTIKLENSGIVFPDGSMRMIWRKDNSKKSFDESFDIIKAAVQTLMTMQQMPYFQASENEYESKNFSGLASRRKKAMIELGIYPVKNGNFMLRSENEREELLRSFQALQVASENADKFKAHDKVSHNTSMRPMPH